MLFLFSVSGEDKPVMTNVKMMDHVIALQRMRETESLKKGYFTTSSSSNI